MSLFLICYYTLDAQYIGRDGGGGHQSDEALVPTSTTSHRNKREKEESFCLLIHAVANAYIFPLRVLFFVYFLSKAGEVDPAERPLSPPYDELPASSSLN